MAKYTAQHLNNLSADQIKIIATELNINVSKRPTKKVLINRILDFQNKQSTLIPINFETSKNDISTQAYKQSIPIEISLFIVQINKSNLLDYFGSGLIYPENYEIRELARSQRTKDIQHLAPNHLLISDGFTDVPNDQQVLIEVSLSQFDKQNLIKIHEMIYLLPYPLPISRVNKLYFSNKESQDNSVASANTFADAFLPTHLFDLWSDKIENRINIVREIQASQIPNNKQLKIDGQNKFNRVLGMLAFMKNAELYYANETYRLNLYSDAYFKVLREINQFFDKYEIGKLDDAILPYYLNFVNPNFFNPNITLQKIVSAIFKNDTFRKDIFKQILGNPSEEVKNAFTLLVSDRTIEALQAMKEPESILLAFLYRFRDKDGSDKYALKEQIPYLINRKSLKFTTKIFSRASIVLSVLGLYYGYRNLPKEEEINFKDGYFASFSDNGKFNIKYKLDNLLDRITIESVYQYCFWDNQKNDFDFLKDDKAIEKFDLKEGYSDEKTFSIIENYPIIRISKQHSETNSKVKKQTGDIWRKILPLIAALKKNGLVQQDETLDTFEFDVWLHNNPSSDLEKLLAEFYK
jgi:hypothetical protein